MLQIIKNIFKSCEHNWKYKGSITEHETYSGERTGKKLGEYEVYVCTKCLKSKKVRLY